MASVHIEDCEASCVGTTVDGKDRVGIIYMRMCSCMLPCSLPPTVGVYTYVVCRTGILPEWEETLTPLDDSRTTAIGRITRMGVIQLPLDCSRISLEGNRTTAIARIAKIEAILMSLDGS